MKDDMLGTIMPSRCLDKLDVNLDALCEFVCVVYRSLLCENWL